MATCIEDTNAKIERREFDESLIGQAPRVILNALRDMDGMRWCRNCHVVWDSIFPESERFDMGVTEVRALYPCTQDAV